MKKAHWLRIRATVQFYAVLFLILSEGDAQAADGKQADETNTAIPKVYRDSKGFLAMEPIESWSLAEDPSETIRTKIRLFHPEDLVSIVIIAGPAPSPSYSVDDLYKETKQRVDEVLPQKLPGGTFSLERRTVGACAGVSMRMTYKAQNIDQCTDMTVKNGIYYSVAYNGREHYARFQNTFERFLSSLVFLDKRETYSDANIAESMASSKGAIAENCMKMGQLEEAEELVKAGLLLDPDNTRCLALRTKLKATK